MENQVLQCERKTYQKLKVPYLLPDKQQFTHDDIDTEFESQGASLLADESGKI